jgi:hypothetical protein
MSGGLREDLPGSVWRYGEPIGIVKRASKHTADPGKALEGKMKFRATTGAEIDMDKLSAAL